MTTAWVRCVKCKHDNVLGLMHCSECGAKLDLSEKHIRHVRGRSPFRALRVVVLLAFIGILGLLLWPVEPLGERGNHDDAVTFYRKLVRLDHAIKKERSGPR